MNAVLSCQDVSVRFGDFTAVDRTSIDFEEGRICAVIGPNGAGKTTLLNVLAGRVGVSSGRVLLRGRDITRTAPHRRANAGIGRSFQIVSLFGEMTVFENFRVAAQARRGGLQPFWKPIGSDANLLQRAEHYLEQVGLADKRDRVAGTLSHGDQRAMEIGLALVTDPPVLLLDEPLAGMGHSELSKGIELLQRVIARRTVVLVEHNMDLVMNISDEIAVLVAGRVLVKDVPARIRENEEVRRAYLG
jgi:branched-chain amino acid transport system ATP-binding protein